MISNRPKYYGKGTHLRNDVAFDEFGIVDVIGEDATQNPLAQFAISVHGGVSINGWISSVIMSRRGCDTTHGT